MSKEKYPLHSHWVMLFAKAEEILNNLKNKSTPLIENDAYIPPINYERTDLPWALGSKAHPWKNLFIANCKASDLTPKREEVIDVYDAIVNAKASVQVITIQVNTADWEDVVEGGLNKYKLTVECSKATNPVVFLGSFKKFQEEVSPGNYSITKEAVVTSYKEYYLETSPEEKTVTITSFEPIDGEVRFLVGKDTILTKKIIN